MSSNELLEPWNPALATGGVEADVEHRFVPVTHVVRGSKTRKAALEHIHGAIAFSAAQIASAAVITFDWPGVTTTSESESYITTNPHALSTALSANENFQIIYAMCVKSLAILAPEIQACRQTIPMYTVQPRIIANRRLIGILQTLVFNSDIALFHVEKLFWEDLALPHRVLTSTTRKTLRKIRHRIILSNLVARGVVLSLRLSLIGHPTS